MSHRRFTRSRSGSDRKSLWLQFTTVDTTIAAGAATLIFTLNAAALALRPFTVIRTHFGFLQFSDQAAVIENQLVAVGMAIVSDQAVAVGITAIPTPMTESGSSLWFAHKLLYSREQSITDRAQPAGVWDLDSKAMRKVEVGSDLAIVLENSTVGSGSVTAIGGRILIKTN